MLASRFLIVGIASVVTLASCTSGEEASVQEPRAGTPGEARNVAATDAPERCSRDRIPHKRADVRAVAFARGDGPVFVGLGSPDIVNYKLDTREHKGWYYNKTLWAVAPEYRGDVTITGHQIDGSHQLRFIAGTGFPGVRQEELSFGRGGGSWRYGASDTLIRADGCYAFRIEGDGFIDWVTFIALS